MSQGPQRDLLNSQFPPVMYHHSNYACGRIRLYIFEKHTIEYVRLRVVCSCVVTSFSSTHTYYRVGFRQVGYLENVFH